MSPRGFRLTIDGASGCARLDCAVCDAGYRFEPDDSEVVVAAVTATFMAAHWDCCLAARG